MRALLAGRGAREALHRGGDGRVVASFRRACYVAMPAGGLVLVAPDVAPGPVHLVLGAEPPRPAPGRRAHVAGASLVVDGVSIDLDGVEPWRGGLPDPAQVRAHALAISAAVSGWSVGSPLLRAPFDTRARAARVLLHRGRLREAADTIAGLGPGLTPSGDDALAGIVFGLRAVWGPGVEALTRAAAEALPEDSLGRWFVVWAARGQAFAPMHELLEAGVSGNADRAARAARAVASVGETSGRDLLLGLRWGLSAWRAYGPAVFEGAGSAAIGGRGGSTAIAR